MFPIFLLLPISIIMKKTSDQDIIHAIDCGNYMRYHSFNGIKYKSDRFFQGSSQFIDYNNKIEIIQIKETLDQDIFQTQRQGFNFFYQLPLNMNSSEIQNFILMLDFAELQYSNSNERIFEVYLGNKLIIANLDIYKEVGRETALTIEIHFQIQGQEAFYKDELLLGAINKKNELIIRLKAIKNQASIAGIILKFGGKQNNQSDVEERKIRRNPIKGIDGLKKLSDESLKIVEQEVKENQKDRDQNEDQEDKRIQIMEIKLLEFSKRLMTLIIQTPLGILLGSSFLLICLITLWELRENRKQENKNIGNIKDIKQD
ncbi:unnamed protein product [Paramecium sonneborni]|uniref:Malectin domain-containing protein n=1 Tax=Paramecium sonneborni TaxID=65129 RepID=A0A8S1N2J9_9CILI|nr:unnamed protein product [Paramecium sonneborni]